MNELVETPLPCEPATGLLPAPPVPAWEAMRALPFRVSVSVPITGLKLRRLCRLSVGDLLTANVGAAEDVPVRAGGALLAWAELDSVDGQMAVRLSRLA